MENFAFGSDCSNNQSVWQHWCGSPNTSRDHDTSLEPNQGFGNNAMIFKNLYRVGHDGALFL